MARILLYAFLAWVLYKLVFHFIIPVYITTRRMKKKFREMQEQMQGRQPNDYPQQPEQKSKPKTAAGDYIDFEEVK
jgi:hypothetical protein